LIPDATQASELPEQGAMTMPSKTVPPKEAEPLAIGTL